MSTSYKNIAKYFRVFQYFISIMKNSCCCMTLLFASLFILVCVYFCIFLIGFLSFIIGYKFKKITLC